MTAPTTQELQPLKALFGARRFAEMEAHASSLLARHPASGMVWKSLAVALQIQGKDALTALQNACTLLPGDPEPPSKHGALHAAAGRLDEAAASYRRALAIQPDFADTHGNLGLTQTRQGQLDAAVSSLRRALQLKPDFTEAHNKLGNALMLQGRADEAAQSFRRALALNPQHLRANASLGAALNDLGHADESLASYGLAARPHGGAQQPCRGVPRAGAHRRGGGLLPSTASLLAQAREFGALAESLARPFSDWPSTQTRDSRRPLRVGFVSGDLRAHPVGYFVQGLLAGLSERVEVFAYSNSNSEDENTAAIKARCRTWRNIATLADEPAASLGHISFGSFNKLSKMTDSVLATWARVLHAVPGSHLHLKTRELDAPPTRQAITERFAARGIAAERLRLEGTTAGRAEHLARYAEVDIALDPFPYPGTTTSVEGLWMGVPVLTTRGERARGRQGESVLHNVGLSDWIAADPEDYVARAARLAGDLAGLKSLRRGLRERLLASPLCDAPRFAANFEAALRSTLGS